MLELFLGEYGAYAVFVLGLLLGSFLNVVILRLPKRLEAQWRNEAREHLGFEDGYEALPPSLVVDRSRCGSCGTALKWYHNIPLLSWLLLRGKCGFCQSRISWQYPLVELLTGVLLLLVFLRFGATTQALWAGVLTLFLIAATGIDFRTQLLPDQLTYPLLWLGLLLALKPEFVELDQAVLGAALGYLSLWSVFWMFKLATGKEGMGYGDFKLLAALGAWCGPWQLPTIVMMSALSGALIGGILLLLRGKSLPFAFGPYLAIAGWLGLLYGEQLTKVFQALMTA